MRSFEAAAYGLCLTNTLWPHLSCRPVPPHLEQLWCAWLKIKPCILCLPWHFEHFTHGLRTNDAA